MSDLHVGLWKLLRSAGIVLLSTVLSRGIAFGAEVAIVRALSPSAFGTVAVAYTLALVVSRLSLLGVPQGVTRFVSDSNGDKDEQTVAKHGLLLVTPVAVLASASFFLFPARVGALLNSDGATRSLVFFAPFVLAFPLARVAIAVLRAHENTIPAMLSKDLVPRVAGLFLFVGLATAGADEFGAVVYWASLPLVSLALAAYYLGRDLGGGVLGGAVDQSSLRKLWSFSWPLAASSSLIILFSNMDVLMIEYFLTSESVGYYRSVQPLRQVTEFVLSSFVFLYLPLATDYHSAGERDRLVAFYKTSTKWVTILTLPIVLVFVVFADSIISVLYTSTYSPASTVLSVLVGGLFFNVLVGPNGATAKAIGRPRIDLASAGAGFAINLALNIVLIPRYGIVGAAVATVIGYVTFNLVEVLLIRRRIGSLPFSLNQLKPLVPTTAVALGLGWYLGGPVGPLGLAGIGALLSLCHLCVVLVTRSVDENDREVIELIETELGRRIPYARSLVDRFSSG